MTIFFVYNRLCLYCLLLLPASATSLSTKVVKQFFEIIIKLQYISLPFPPYKLYWMCLPTLISASLFFSNWLLHACMYIYVILIFLNITYSVYRVLLCMHVFRADPLVLDNQLMCFSLGRATSPTSSFPQLSVVLYVK